MSEPSGAERLHVTFVCTGNICRSPIAEKVFATQIARRGLSSSVRVSSAGTGSWHAGDGADPRAEAVLRAHGYPEDHVAAVLDHDHLDADLVVAMGREHLRILRRRGVPTERLRMLRSFAPSDGTTDDAPDVEDPYYGGAADFAETLAVVEASLPGLHDWVDARLGEDGRAGGRGA